MGRRPRQFSPQFKFDVVMQLLTHQKTITEPCRAQRGASVSMSAVGRPTDNPCAERVIRRIKEEEVYLNEYQDLADARAHLGRFI